MLWWAPPEYVEAGEAKWRIEGGTVKPVWNVDQGQLIRKGQDVVASSKNAGRRPIEISEPREMEDLTGPIDFESQGEENIYFTDGYGQRYFYKSDGRDVSKIHRYFRYKS
jgi:hypothetical protein